MNEPADGGYVVGHYRDAETGFTVFRRRDDWAKHNGLGNAHWFNRNNMEQPALTWAQLTMLYRLAYVGEFVDRSAA